MLKFRKLIVSFLLVICLSSPALAFVPLIIPAWVLASSAVLGVAAVVSGVHYGMRLDMPSSVSNMGVVSRATAALFATAAANVVTINQKNLVSTMSFGTAVNLATKLINGSPVYPILNTAYSRNNLAPDASWGSAVGDIIHTTSGNKRIESIGWNSVSDSWADTYGPIQYGSPSPVMVFSGHGSGGTNMTLVKVFNLDNNGGIPLTVPNRNSTAQEANFSLTGSNAGGSVIPGYQAEIDKMYQDSTYIPTFNDDDLAALPWIPPAGVLTPEQLTAANTAGQAAASAIAANNASQGAAATAATNNNAAQTAATAATAAAAADPTNPALAAAAAAAIAAAANTSTAAATTAAAAAASTAATDAAAAATPVVVIPAAPTKVLLNMAPILALNGLLATTYPFNLPTAIGTYFSQVAVSPQAPVFDLALPLGQSIHADLAIFDPIATMCRYLVGLLVTVGLLFYIVHFFRGIS